MRRERIQAWMRPVIRWIYLATSVLILPLVIEGLLEQTGLLRPPVEGTIPEPVHMALLFASLATGGVIFLGWPVAIAVVGLYWREWPLVTPALLFLVAEASFAVYLVGFPGSNALFVVSGGFLGIYAIAALWAWARMRPRSRRRHSAAIMSALLLTVPLDAGIEPADVGPGDGQPPPGPSRHRSEVVSAPTGARYPPESSLHVTCQRRA